MIRIVTAIAFALTVVLLASAIVAFVTGWWIVGIVAALLTFVTSFYTLAGMSIIVLESIDD